MRRAGRAQLATPARPRVGLIGHEVLLRSGRASRRRHRPATAHAIRRRSRNRSHLRRFRRPATSDPAAVVRAPGDCRLDRGENRDGRGFRRLGRGAASRVDLVAGRRRRAPCRARLGSAGAAGRGSEPAAPPSLRGCGAGAGSAAYDAAKSGSNCRRTSACSSASASGASASRRMKALITRPLR